MKRERATFSTAGDRNFGFISKLEVKEEYFGGHLRRHDPESATILHMGQELFPFWSVVHKQEDGHMPIHYLCAIRADNIPVSTIFVESEPSERVTAWLLSLVQLMLTRKFKSRSVACLERSQACMEGGLPKTHFIRDAFKLMPCVGCQYLAVFPGRDPTARIICRFVSYVTAWKMSLLQFLMFDDGDDLHTWVQEHRAALLVSNLSLSYNMQLKTDASMEFMRDRFEFLKTQWPQDTTVLERLLGCSKPPPLCTSDHSESELLALSPRWTPETSMDVAVKLKDIVSFDTEVAPFQIFTSPKSPRGQSDVNKKSLAVIDEEDE